MAIKKKYLNLMILQASDVMTNITYVHFYYMSLKKPHKSEILEDHHTYIHKDYYNNDYLF